MKTTAEASTGLHSDILTHSSPSIGPDILANAQRIVITMANDAADTSTNLETIRRRLGDIATCRGILEKTKTSLLTASESLHLDSGDLAEFDRAKAFIEALLPIIEKADEHARDACKLSVELLCKLKDYAAKMHASSLSSELKKPDTQYIIPTTISLAPCLSYVQEATKEAIMIVEKPDTETQKLKLQGKHIMRVTLFGSVGFLGLLSFMGRSTFVPFLGMVLLFFGVAAYYGRLYREKKQAIMKGEREQAIRKGTIAALKRVQLISTHVASLCIPERINSELAKSEPFGLPPASEGWLKVGNDLQETINAFEGSQ